jgi:hypothetical protein
VKKSFVGPVIEPVRHEDTSCHARCAIRLVCQVGRRRVPGERNNHERSQEDVRLPRALEGGHWRLCLYLDQILSRIPWRDPSDALDERRF